VNKLPTKQIYLLLVIIVGIIALSVYSTYAIFTFESQTSEAFNIKLPSALEIKTDMYEYKQLEIPKNSVQTTDIDLYNTYDYELCYSIWYKVLNSESQLVNIYEISDTTLKASGTIMAQDQSRFTLLITNDSDEDIKINLGLAAVKATDTCSLQLSSDKKNIREIYDQEIINLKDKIISTLDDIKVAPNDDSLIYKNKTVELSFPQSITVANEYTIVNHQYVLSEPQEILNEKYLELLSNIDYQAQDYYICSNDACDTIYRINTAKIEQDQTANTINYLITNVDEYELYQKGSSGLKQVAKNYYYYGDNPNNFLYYNCQNDQLTSCELWRIIGLIYDEENNEYHLKIIRNDSLGKYQYNTDLESNTWYTEDYQSSLYKYLNDDYLVAKQFVSLYPHTIEEISNLNISLKDIPNTKIATENRAVTLMNLTDYLYTSTCSNGNINTFNDCLTDNWLHRIKISKEWTLTSPEEITPDNNITPEPDSTVPSTSNDETQNLPEETIPEIFQPIEKQMYTVGSTIGLTPVTTEAAVRPVVYLKERLLYYSGDGSFDNPYIIK